MNETDFVKSLNTSDFSKNRGNGGTERLSNLMSITGLMSEGGSISFGQFGSRVF